MRHLADLFIDETLRMFRGKHGSTSSVKPQFSQCSQLVAPVPEHLLVLYTEKDCYTSMLTRGTYIKYKSQCNSRNMFHGVGSWGMLLHRQYISNQSPTGSGMHCLSSPCHSWAPFWHCLCCVNWFLA